MKLLSLTVAAFASNINRNKSCANPDENEDHMACRHIVENILTSCIGRCEGDSTCVSACSREYANNYSQCPCMASCPDGCPCSYADPPYDCPS